MALASLERGGDFAFVFAPTKSELEEMRYTYFACYFECVFVVCVLFVIYVTDNCIRVSLCLLFLLFICLSNIIVRNRSSFCPSPVIVSVCVVLLQKRLQTGNCGICGWVFDVQLVSRKIKCLC